MCLITLVLELIPLYRKLNGETSKVVLHDRETSWVFFLKKLLEKLVTDDRRIPNIKLTDL